MTQLESYGLGREPEDEEETESGPAFYEPREERSFGFVLLLGVLAVAAGTGGYLYYRARQAPAPAPAATTLPAQRATPLPVPEPEAVGLPPLAQSDAFLRDLAKGLSTHAQLSLWLAQNGLARLFANVTEIVAKGESPRASLAFLAPKGSFAVARRKGREVIDAKSFARYDAFAEGVAALDPAASAGAFRRALPLFESAYRELGYPEGGFEKTLRAGIAHLLAVPVVEGEVGVKPVRRGNLQLYEYADPALESLSPAQKHLLRMGPPNVKRIQETLRAFVSALGS
jgi:Protein of unknown function (DUF3014)